jgi:hypothetical protein
LEVFFLFSVRPGRIIRPKIFNKEILMKRLYQIMLVLGFIGAATLAAASQSKTEKTVAFPEAVAQAVKAHFPGAEIKAAEVEKEAGINFYDIEFTAGRGEIEVAEDGTVMDISTIITMKELPKAAAEAIQTAASGATIRQIERSEVRAEIKRGSEEAKLVKLASPRYLYEADLIKGDQKAEVQVAPDGNVVEAPKWQARIAEKKEEAEENEEAAEKEEAEGDKPATVDMKILPPAVISAFNTAYPKAVIKGTSKETEKGVTYYEIESVDGKMNRDLLYTAEGKAIEIEEAVAPGALPIAVTQVLAKAYPGYKILKAEDLVKGGQKYFELLILVKGKKIGVTIDSAGKTIQ